MNTYDIALGRMQQLRALVADNGVRWATYFLFSKLLSDYADRLDKRLEEMERESGLPGTNSVAKNHELWQNWNWKDGGEEWTISPEWKQALIDDVMLRYVERGKRVLEIGPGAGRWTESLQKISSSLVLVDLSERCIEICKGKFRNCENVQYFVNDGSTLNFIPAETIERIWSFDVFVHIAPRETEKYLIEFLRVMTPGGRAIVHHPRTGRRYGGWRSGMTTELFATMLRERGFSILHQIDSWGECGRFNLSLHEDLITVFEKPRS